MKYLMLVLALFISACSVNNYTDTTDTHDRNKFDTGGEWRYGSDSFGYRGSYKEAQTVMKKHPCNGCILERVN